MTALMGLTTVMALARVQVILSPGEAGFAYSSAQIDALTAEGVDLVQVRRPTGVDETEADRVFNDARSRALPRHSLVAVGHDLAWARRVQADVVHLGASDPPTDQGVAAVAPYGLVGRSVHSEQELRAALGEASLSYLNVGPVYGAGAEGLDLVRLAASLAPPQQPGAMAWFAVGGITLERLPEVLDAGALRIGVGAAVTGASDPVAMANSLVEAMRKAWEVTPGMDRVRMAAFRLGHRTNDDGDVGSG